MMEFTLTDRLDLICGAPLDDRLVLEVDDEHDELGLDKRLGVTASWKRYKDRLEDIATVRDRAKAVGLDAEFKKAVLDALEVASRRPGSNIKPRTRITKEDPLGFTEVLHVVNGLRPFLRQLEKAEGTKDTELETTKLPKVRDAIQKLREAAGIEEGEGTTLMKLLNPGGATTGQHFRYQPQFTPGGKGLVTYKLDNAKPLDEQFKTVTKVIASYIIIAEKANELNDAAKYRKLLRSLKDGVMLRLTLLQHYWPKRTESQKKYTAAFYALRTLVDEWDKLGDNRVSSNLGLPFASG